MRELPPHDPNDLGCPHCGERCDVCVDTLVETTELRAEVERLREEVTVLRDVVEDLTRATLRMYCRADASTADRKDAPDG